MVDRLKLGSYQLLDLEEKNKEQQNALIKTEKKVLLRIVNLALIS